MVLRYLAQDTARDKGARDAEKPGRRTEASRGWEYISLLGTRVETETFYNLWRLVKYSGDFCRRSRYQVRKFFSYQTHPSIKFHFENQKTFHSLMLSKSFSTFKQGFIVGNNSVRDLAAGSEKNERICVNVSMGS